jgi:radical SAM protein with 4Fe4S-binding SPASM domain
VLKIFKEHPNFDQYTRFDTSTGRLETITETDFKSYLPDNYQASGARLQHTRHNGVEIFDGETYETHVRFPRRIYFQITRHCNLNCPACFIKADKYGKHVPTESIFKAAEFFAKQGLIEVRLTGGEPTTHPDFISILHKFNEANIYTSVATNGVIPMQTLHELAKQKNLWIICSIDGNEATHNSYRQNSFQTIIKNLRFLRENNDALRIRLTTILTKKNKDQMDEIVKIAAGVGAESVTVIPLRPQVRDQHMHEEMVTSQEFKRAICALLEAQEKYKVRVTTTLETEYKKDIYPDPVFRKKSSCAAGREGTNLDYDYAKQEFILYGCAYSPAVDLNCDERIRAPFLAGSFLANEIEKFVNIWQTESAWKIYRDLTIRSEKCLSCEYLNNQQCTGSCPIQNVNFSSVDVNEDILRQLKYQIQKTGEWYCYQDIFKDIA